MFYFAWQESPSGPYGADPFPPTPNTTSLPFSTMPPSHLHLRKGRGVPKNSSGHCWASWRCRLPPPTYTCSQVMEQDAGCGAPGSWGSPPTTHLHFHHTREQTTLSDCMPIPTHERILNNSYFCSTFFFFLQIIYEERTNIPKDNVHYKIDTKIRNSTRVI